MASFAISREHVRNCNSLKVCIVICHLLPPMQAMHNFGISDRVKKDAQTQLTVLWMSLLGLYGDCTPVAFIPWYTFNSHSTITCAQAASGSSIATDTPIPPYLKKSKPHGRNFRIALGCDWYVSSYDHDLPHPRGWQVGSPFRTNDFQSFNVFLPSSFYGN